MNINTSATAMERVIEIGMHGDASAGGVDRYFWGLHDAIQSQGFSFTALAYHFDETGSSQREGGRVSLGSPKLPLSQRLKALRNGILQELRTRHPGGSSPRFLQRQSLRNTVLVSHFALYALPLLPELNRVAHVVHFHGPWAQESDAEGQPWTEVMAKKAIEKLVYSTARAFITLSQAFRQLLIRDYGIPSHKIHVIPGGVDLGRFRPGEQRAARALLGWPQDRRLLLCVRRLTARMGLENLILGFSRIAARHNDTELVIGGKGPLLSRLEALAASLGLQNRVRFTGFIPERHLPAAYQAASATIMPSERLEGFGLAAVESLACGTPVLVTPVGGLPEIMHSFAPRCVLAGTGEEAIAEGLDAFLKGQLTAPTSEVCRTHTLQHFSWEQVARQASAVYQEAASGRCRSKDVCATRR